MHLVADRDVDVQHRRTAASASPRARRSTPRTATNMARAAAGCCCLPAAGRRSRNGPTRAGDFAESSPWPSRSGLRPNAAQARAAKRRPCSLPSSISPTWLIVTWIIIAQVILSWLLAFNVLNTSSSGVRDVHPRARSDHRAALSADPPAAARFRRDRLFAAGRSDPDPGDQEAARRRRRRNIIAADDREADRRQGRGAGDPRAASRRTSPSSSSGPAAPPGLATVLVGEDPASAVYVRSKNRATAEAGMASFAHNLPDTTREDDFCSSSTELNADERVDGILVQLPLPPQIDATRVIETHRSGQGRRRLPSGQRRPAGDRPPRARAVHAARLPLSAEAGARRPRRAGRGRDRPLEHRRQADGAAAARRELHRDDRPFAHPRPARTSFAAPTSSLPPSAGRRWCAATGSSRARR